MEIPAFAGMTGSVNMFTYLFGSKKNSAEIAQQELTTLVKTAIENSDIDIPKLLKDITILVNQGADLNKKINNKTLVYHLLMHIADFHFAQQMFDLGADPRIENSNGTNLFMKPHAGRGVFMQICWLDYIGINLDVPKNSENYADTLKTALMIYHFCSMKEIQKLHQFDCKKNNADDILAISKKLKIFENCMKNSDFLKLKNIQGKYLFYSHLFDKKSVQINFEVLVPPKISAIKPGPRKTKPV